MEKETINSPTMPRGDVLFKMFVKYWRDNETTRQFDGMSLCQNVDLLKNTFLNQQLFNLAVKSEYGVYE